MSKIKYLKPLISLGFLTILIFAIAHLDLNFSDLFKGFENLSKLIEESIPRNQETFTSTLKIGFGAILETLLIAFLGTTFGTIIAFPLALLSAKNLFPKSQKTKQSKFSKFLQKIFKITSTTKAVTKPYTILSKITPIKTIARTILAAIRTLPSLLWAVIFVALVGLGPLAGVLAMTFYTVGYLGKLQYETLEGINKEPIEAVSAIGVSKFQLIRYTIMPEAANSLISQILFMFEYNVRASSILGFVGAGGIGFYIGGYLKFLEYDKVFTLLLIIFATILIIDFISTKIRQNWLQN